MNWSDLLEKLGRGNSNEDIFLSRISEPRHITKHGCALANGNGGSIFIGIDTQHFHLIGCDYDANWFASHLKTQIQPPIDFAIETISKNDKSIAHLIIKKGEFKPYTTHNSVYLREEGQTRLATTEEESELRSVGEDYTPPQETLLEKPDTQPLEPIEPTPLPQAEYTMVDLMPSSPKPEQLDEAPSTQDSQLINPTYTESPSYNPAPSNISTPLATTPTSTQQAPYPEVSDAEQWNERQLQALEYLKHHPSITNKEYRTLFDISHKTAHIELAAMTTDGPLRIKGAGRSTAYVLDAQCLPKNNIVSLIHRN